MSTEHILPFIYELGQLRRIKHEGWRLIGIENPDSVADHSFRAAQIGFLLAHLEHYPNPYEVCTMLVFHDIGECRIGDLHKVASRYVTADEERAVQEQTEPLGITGKDIFRLWKEVEEKKTSAGIIAKDADLLEQAVTAKEYVEKGYSYAQDWITNVGKRLQTNAAKELWAQLEITHSNIWWQGLKKIPK